MHDDSTPDAFFKLLTEHWEQILATVDNDTRSALERLARDGDAEPFAVQVELEDLLLEALPPNHPVAEHMRQRLMLRSPVDTGLSLRDQQERWRRGIGSEVDLSSTDPEAASDPAPENTTDAETTTEAANAETDTDTKLQDALESGDRALSTGDPDDLSVATEQITALLAALDAAHPRWGVLHGLLCHLRVLQASSTGSTAHIPSAVEAGIESVRAALAAGEDGVGPNTHTVEPLVLALIVALSRDLRTGLHAPARDVLQQTLEHPDLDRHTQGPSANWLRVAVQIGLGVSSLLSWRNTAQEDDRREGQQRLEQAETSLMEPDKASIGSIRHAFELIQVHGSAVMLWRDSDSATAGLRIIGHLETMLDDHPELAEESRRIFASQGPTSGPSALVGTDLRQTLGMMRSLFQMLQNGPFTGPDQAADRLLSEYLTGEAMSGTATPDQTAILRDMMASLGLDPELMRAVGAQLADNPELLQEMNRFAGAQGLDIQQMMSIFNPSATEQPEPPPPPPNHVPPDPPAAAGLMAEVRRGLLTELATLHEDAAGRDAGRPGLIRLTDEHGTVHLPTFQFGEGSEPHPVVLETNEVLWADRDPWGAASWWAYPHARIGRAPIELVGSDREVLLPALAARLGED